MYSFGVGKRPMINKKWKETNFRTRESS